MSIAVLTNVRTDTFFLALWVAYYGNLFGRENLHIMLDGDDWTPQVDLSGVNLHVVPDVPRERTLRLGFTSRWQSRHAAGLLKGGTDLVLRTDIDEFVAADPASGMDLPALLASLPEGAAAAALGLDVIQAPEEGPLDTARPILAQRRHAILTREFCKLVAIRRHVRWMGGASTARAMSTSTSSPVCCSSILPSSIVPSPGHASISANQPPNTPPKARISPSDSPALTRWQAPTRPPSTWSPPAPAPM